jgi:tetratricopeptide (TPR) repeat protein
MLPEALSQADKKLKRERFLTILLATVTIMTGVVVLVVFSFLEPEVTQPVNAPTVVSSPAAPIDVSRSREQFMQALKHFESEIEPQLASANLPAWNQQAATDIPALKAQALSLFTQEQYATALETLARARSLAEATLKDREQRFANAYADALALFNEHVADRAELKIDEALTLKPSNPDALTLKARIEVLPEVTSLMRAAAIAKTENNVRKELEALKQVVVLDPARVMINQRIPLLEQQLAELEYASYISRGLKAVEDHDLRKANASLARAQAIFPGRREARILTDRIAKTARSLSLANAIRKGDAAIASDDWRQAFQIFQQALRSHPDHGELLGKIDNAKKIITLDDALADYLSRHHRLSSPNVAAAARNTLQQSREVSHMSRSLASKAAKLDQLLAEYEVPVDVIITSDNKTHISIRGVGNVGVTENKRISLRPGQYMFEGKRPGFRSKLVRVVLNAGQRNARVAVICDERI